MSRLGNIVILAVASAALTGYCEIDARAASPASANVSTTLQKGRTLANAYCVSCHIFPEPDLLTKSNWVHGALRNMAPFLGVARLNLDSRPDGEILKEAAVFPTTPMLSKSDWEAIVAFYSEAAPTSPAAPARITSVANLFSPRPLWRSPDAPCTTLLQIDSDYRVVYVGDAQTRTLKCIDSRGSILRQWETDSGPVALTRTGSNLIVTLIGRILPSDELAGQVWQLPADSAAAPVRLIRGLRRPVHTALPDLDRDGNPEMVVSSFGNRLGRLSAFIQESSGTLREDIIVEAPGTVRCLPHDWNGDGLIDLTVLRAQGREGADLYLNKGSGRFDRVVLWEDASAYGNAFMDLVDFDRDGRPELLVANGDNGDFNCAPKAYHGLRVFAIDREFKARLRFQFRFFGAYGARAADFDLDGDLDIAAISYFPDYERAPDQSFVYLRNDAEWNFTPHVIPNLNQGRWIVMDAGDLDNDGDVDLLLGSFVRGPLTIPIPEPLQRRWETERLAVLWLENQTRHPVP